MVLAEEWEYSWVTLTRGRFMKKLNTHSLYILGQRIQALTTLEYKPELTFNDIFVRLIRAEIALKTQVRGEFFSSSLKRSAGAVLRAMYAPWDYQKTTALKIREQQTHQYSPSKSAS